MADCKNCFNWEKIYRKCWMKLKKFKHYECIDGGGITKEEFLEQVYERARGGWRLMCSHIAYIKRYVNQLEPVNAEKGRRIASKIRELSHDLRTGRLNFTDYKYGKIEEGLQLDGLILECFEKFQKWQEIMERARPTARHSVEERRSIEVQISKAAQNLREFVGDETEEENNDDN